MSSILNFGQILVHLANVRGAAVSSHSLDWTPKGIPWVWRHMRGFLKSRCDSHAPSLNKFTSFGESFLRLYCSVRYVLQLKVTFHVCPCIPTYISRLKFAFATLPAQLPALKLRHQNDHIQNEPPGSRFNTRDGSIREMGLEWTGEKVGIWRTRMALILPHVG